MTDSPGSISGHFSNITDPRDDNSRHLLIDIITIAVCAVICGADAWEHMEEFGESKSEWFEEFLALPHGIPSHDTFRRVFARIDPDEFQESFISWVQALWQLTEGQVIAIDGKTLRRSHDSRNGKRAIHMVSAWASANGIVLGQVKTDEKSNEITAIPELIKALEVKDCIVTIDAMGCQKNIAKLIVDKGADYVLALKDNQSTLHDSVELFFQDSIRSASNPTIDFHQYTDGAHGRIEVRRHWTTSDIQWLQGKESWENITTVAMVERERDVDDHISVETSYYISSIGNDAKLLSKAVRSHWGIENSLHWVLDVSFREDESRIRKDNGPENFAVLRHMALNLLKGESSSKKSIKAKRLKAGWDNQYLAKVVFG
jgi:predicted transposase YbfD/YdcC